MTDTTQSRADRLIEETEAGAMAHAKRIGANDHAAMLYQIQMLEQLVRSLSAAVDLQAESIENQREEIQRQRSAIELLNGSLRRSREQVRRQHEELSEAGLMPDAEGDGHAAAMFAVSTGAAAALRGV